MFKTLDINLRTHADGSLFLVRGNSVFEEQMNRCYKKIDYLRWIPTEEDRKLPAFQGPFYVVGDSSTTYLLDELHFRNSYPIIAIGKAICYLEFLDLENPIYFLHEGDSGIASLRTPFVYPLHRGLYKKHYLIYPEEIHGHLSSVVSAIRIARMLGGSTCYLYTLDEKAPWCRHCIKKNDPRFLLGHRGLIDKEGYIIWL